MTSLSNATRAELIEMCESLSDALTNKAEENERLLSELEALRASVRGSEDHGSYDARPQLAAPRADFNVSELVERVARAIADEIGPSYDDAYENKAEWIDDRGKRADINAPRKSDYRDAARAAIKAVDANPDPKG